MYNTVKVHTKDAHTVCRGPTLKDVERSRKNRFANSMRHILMSEHLSVKLSQRIMLYQSYLEVFMSERL